MTFASPAAFFEEAADVNPRSLERGDETEQDAGESRHTKRESENPVIDSNLIHSRRAFWNDREQNIDEPDTKNNPSNTADRGKQNTLGQHLPDDTATARSHRGADRDFLLARGAASEKKIGHVRTGDQQDEPHSAEKRKERRLCFAHDSFVKNREIRVPAFVCIGKFLCVLRVDRADTGLRLL